MSTAKASAASAKRAAAKQRPAGGQARYLALIGAVIVALLAAAYATRKAAPPPAEPRPARRVAAAAEEPAAEDVDPSRLAEHVRELRREEASALPCDDTDASCVSWAGMGECKSNAGYMLESCKASCGLCGKERDARSTASTGGCRDEHPICSTWASIGECKSNPSFMHAQCRVACKLCQSDACNDKRTDCAERAENGGCYSRAGMRNECAWTCVSCSTVDSPKCTRDPAAAPAGGVGRVEAMFERIAGMGAVEGSPRSKVHVLSTSPWVVTIDDFLSEQEADALLAAGGANWSRSLAGDGVQQARTSSTSWCRETCLDDSSVQAVQLRVEALTGVPVQNAEYMQALRYMPGEYYKVHHDQNSPRSSAWGPRLYTFFM